MRDRKDPFVVSKFRHNETFSACLCGRPAKRTKKSLRCNERFVAIPYEFSDRKTDITVSKEQNIFKHLLEDSHWVELIKSQQHGQKIPANYRKVRNHWKFATLVLHSVNISILPGGRFLISFRDSLFILRDNNLAKIECSLWISAFLTVSVEVISISLWAREPKSSITSFPRSVIECVSNSVSRELNHDPRSLTWRLHGVFVDHDVL